MPVNPKELTPARRGLPLACHGVALSTTRTGSESHGMCGDGFSKCRLCGSTSCCSDNTTLIRPATPDADSRWPMLVFTDPISKRSVRVTRGAVGGRGRLHLDRITQRGARPVRLEVVDVPAGQTGASQRRGDKPLLCATIGHRQTAGSAVLVDRAAGNDRADPIAVAHRVAEPLEHQNSAALTAHVAVGGGVEGLASPDGGKHPGA